MATHEEWEFRFKACAAISAVLTAVSIVGGGGFALYTYRKQTEASEYLKRKEMRLIEYNKKSEIYFELVDAAATAAESQNKELAGMHAARFYALYFGKAHVAVQEKSVYDAKKRFSRALEKAVKAGAWPTDDLDDPALELSKACRDALQAQRVIEDLGGGSESAASATSR